MFLYKLFQSSMHNVLSADWWRIDWSMFENQYWYHNVVIDLIHLHEVRVGREGSLTPPKEMFAKIYDTYDLVPCHIVMADCSWVFDVL